MPNKQDTNPRNSYSQVKFIEPVKDDKVAYTVASSSIVAPSSCTSAAPPSFYSASIKGTKGEPSCTSTDSGPHITCCPTSSIWTSASGTRYSSTSPDSRSCPRQKHSSSSSSSTEALVVTTARAARRPYICLGGSGLDAKLLSTLFVNLLL